jgi:hypothetical protein
MIMMMMMMINRVCREMVRTEREGEGGREMVRLVGLIDGRSYPMER